MEKIWLVSDDKLSSMKDAIFKDETVNRASITVTSASSLNLDKEGSFIIITGSEESIDQASEILKSDGKELDETESMEVLDRLKDTQDSAASGLGSIFG